MEVFTCQVPTLFIFWLYPHFFLLIETLFAIPAQSAEQQCNAENKHFFFISVKIVYPISDSTCLICSVRSGCSRALKNMEARFEWGALQIIPDVLSCYCFWEASRHSLVSSCELTKNQQMRAPRTVQNLDLLHVPSRVLWSQRQRMTIQPLSPTPRPFWPHANWLHIRCLYPLIYMHRVHFDQMLNPGLSVAFRFWAEKQQRTIWHGEVSGEMFWYTCNCKCVFWHINHAFPFWTVPSGLFCKAFIGNSFMHVSLDWCRWMGLSRVFFLVFNSCKGTC